jgi:hypothetical protein
LAGRTIVAEPDRSAAMRAKGWLFSSSAKDRRFHLSGILPLDLYKQSATYASQYLSVFLMA